MNNFFDSPPCFTMLRFLSCIFNIYRCFVNRHPHHQFPVNGIYSNPIDQRSMLNQYMLTLIINKPHLIFEATCCSKAINNQGKRNIHYIINIIGISN